MSDFFLAEVDPAPDDRGGVLAAFAGAVAVQEVVFVARSGNDDLTRVPVAWLAQHAERALRDWFFVVAVAGSAPATAASGRLGLPRVTPDWALNPDDVLGYATASAPLADNLHLIDDCEAIVRPAARRRGVGTALVATIEALAAPRGRTHLMGWSTHDRASFDDPGALRAREGHLALVPDESTAFALARGWHLAQIERHSVLTISERGPDPRLPAEYTVAAWQGLTQPEHRDAVAELFAVFSVEAPIGDLALEEERWDADRVARREAESDAHLDRLTAVAFHATTGEPAAITALSRERTKPAAVFQDVTLVHPAHRGHGLGLALKLLNLDALRAAWPDARRVHTWNAGENDAMWRINAELGFVTADAEAIWQKEV